MVLAFGQRSGRAVTQATASGTDHVPYKREWDPTQRNQVIHGLGPVAKVFELAPVEQQYIGRRVLAFSSLGLWTWFTSGSATSYPQPLRNVAEGVSIGCNHGIKPSRQQGRTSHSPIAINRCQRFCLWSTFRQGDDSSNCLWNGPGAYKEMWSL